MDRLDDAHIIQRHVQVLPAIVRSLPPVKPVSPKVFRSLRSAHSTALRMLGLLPEPLMARSRSRGLARFLSCSTKTCSETLVVAPGQDVRRVVGQADDTNPFLGVVVEILRGWCPWPMSSQKCEALAAAAAVAADKDHPAAAVTVVHHVGQVLDSGWVVAAPAIPVMNSFQEGANVQGRSKHGEGLQHKIRGGCLEPQRTPSEMGSV